MNAAKTAAALTLAAALIGTPAVARASAARTADSSAAAGENCPGCGGDHSHKPPCRGPRGSAMHGGAMAELSKLTGLSAEQLREKYPQQTAWQIAHTMGRLDALKAAVRRSFKAVFDRMVKEGVVDASERDKMTADLDKRLAAIDGSKTVILGRPGYRPKLKKQPNRTAPKTSGRPAA